MPSCEKQQAVQLLLLPEQRSLEGKLQLRREEQVLPEAHSTSKAVRAQIGKQNPKHWCPALSKAPNR